MTQLTRRNVLLLAIAMAAATTFVAYLFLTRQQVKAFTGAPATQTMVVVARQEIRPLQLLRPDQFTVKQVNADGVPRDAVATPEDLKGKVALVTMLPGQTVSAGQVAARGPELGLAYTVKPPLRAVTVALDPIIGVAGFPKPGNHVDVLATFTTDAVGTVTRTVLQDVEILALGSDIQPKEVDPHTGKTSEARPQVTATLAVLPGEAEKLILAENRGKLRLALRGVDDKTYVSRTMTKELNVVGVAPKPKDGAVTTSAAPAKPALPSEQELTSRARAMASAMASEFKQQFPQGSAPVLPPVHFQPGTIAPAPNQGEHVITVIKGADKQVVRFKKTGRAKVDTTAPSEEAPESN